MVSQLEADGLAFVADCLPTLKWAVILVEADCLPD